MLSVKEGTAMLRALETSAEDPFGPDETHCPIRELLARVGGRWALDVIVQLVGTTRHFGDLERAIPGISRRMLTLTLRGLERDGLLSRSSTGVAGDRVFYKLTALGAGLAVHLGALSRWSQRARDQIYAARDEFDRTAEPFETR
jgi:DNA-binding HxlR family transcriptional regulator